MEVLHPPLPGNPPILSTFSAFTPKFPIKTSANKSAHIFNVATSKYRRKRSFPRYLFSSKTTAQQISARFGGPSRRRNSLRKKLVSDQQVHQNNPISLNPNSSFEKIENLDYDSVEDNDFKYGESMSTPVGESVLLSKLENWFDQYKKDIDNWGIGSGKIFTVFEDSEGTVKKVVVDEEELLRRSKVERREFEDLSEVNSRIMYAKSLAREMEGGANLIPRNSSVANFVVSGNNSGFLNMISGAVLHPEFIPKLSRVGSVVFCSLVVFSAAKRLFSFRNKEVRYTELEKEMMRRKIKSRKEKEKEMLEKGSVEVVQEPLEPPKLTFEKPKIDKQELMENIIKAKTSKDNLALVDSFNSQTSKSRDSDYKFQEIREMARQVHEIEAGKHSQFNRDEEEKKVMDVELSDEIEVVKRYREDVSFPGKIYDGSLEQGSYTHGSKLNNLAVDVQLLDEVEVLKQSREGNVSFVGNISNGSLEQGGVTNETGVDNGVMQAYSASNVEVSKDSQRRNHDSEDTLCTENKRDFIPSSETLDVETCFSTTNSVEIRPRIIRSVKEAREFLSTKRNKLQSDQSIFNNLQEGVNVSRKPSDKESDKTTSQIFDTDKKFGPAIFGGISDCTPALNACDTSVQMNEEHIPINKDDLEYFGEVYGADDTQMSPNSLYNEGIGGSTETGSHTKAGNWMEENFRDIEPLAKKIGFGFRDNFKVAREKVNGELNTYAETRQLISGEDDSEFEWMKDERLREIVFQVRENELAGRDPFHLMDAEDKQAFFHGLEKKVEEENEKLAHVHEWLHANIENLDYGADGISLYDPPEKIIPRWKGPPLQKSPQFLDDFRKQREALFAGNTGASYPVNKDEEIQCPTGSSTRENASASLTRNDLKKKLQDKDPKLSKTVIEGSDGSVRSGKKSGKEYWQHTKKWSRGFLESYNAETDPEVKNIMKGIGKDLDRWITEEEIQEAADLITQLPERNKKFMEKKLSKLKREMELFGPQAVVSKYREYAEEKEEDYLWWLDLPHILCIELYTIEDGQQVIGFYSLEMAQDLELEPKPHHVIAFEDAGDCKNLCYIIQARLEMLGSGNAFVVPRPPKNAFREAKANGFSVTVIRRGELQLNVDQTLEEVEEQITEIGSKMYHDKIMRERSVDISSLMKGVFGVGAKPTKGKSAIKRLKRMLKRSSTK